MEESCSERQKNELQAIKAIYMDDFQDLREKVTSLKFLANYFQISFGLFFKAVSIKHGLRTGYKIRTRYKTRTGKYGLSIKRGLGIKRGLQTVRTVDWV